MNRMMTIKRTLALLALGGATLGLFGTSFGAGGPFGCNWATYADYEAMYTAAGQAVIDRVSDTYFDYGTDWNTFVRTPATDFAQNIWANWVDYRVPEDVELQ